MPPPSPPPSTGGHHTDRIPRTVWMLGFVSLLMDVSSEMVQVLLPLYLVAGLGASALVVGVIEGAAVAIAMLTKVFAGAWSDRTGKRKWLACLGYGLAALSRPVFPLADTVAGIAAGRFLDRIGKGIRGAPRDALIADVTPPALRGRSFGLRKSLDTVGGFAGPLLVMALLLATADDVKLVLWLAIVPALAAMALLIGGVREPERDAAPAAPRRAGWQWRDTLRLNRATWVVIVLSGVLTLARFSEAFLLLKSQQAGFALTWMPLVPVIMHAVYGLSALPAGILSDRIGRFPLLLASLLCLILADLILAQASGVVAMLAGIVLWGLHMGLSQGILATLVAESAPAALRGTAFGLSGLVTGLAALAGNVLAGLLWTTLGPAATFLAGAVFSAITLVGLWYWRRQLVPAA